MKMLGVGNEQWGPQYFERYKVFAEALKAQHPEIQLVVERRSVHRAARTFKTHVGELARA